VTAHLRLRRRAARAILIDDAGRLVLIRRTRPATPVYWTTPGGGVEPQDASVEAALHRELMEELGATATVAAPVLLTSAADEQGVWVQHFLLARLTGLDPSMRNGPEFSDPGRGSYDVEHVDLRSGELAHLDLRPPELKTFILANRDALLLLVDLPQG
jgi:8-oxo-dGTP pyrophosphatase MutT (NUDIX family)